MLEHTEHVFNGAPSNGHCIRLAIEPTLHSLQYMFVLSSSDATIVAARTSLLEMTLRARARPVHPQIYVMLNGRESKNRSLSRGTSILTVPCNVNEIALGKEPFLP